MPKRTQAGKGADPYANLPAFTRAILESAQARAKQPGEAYRKDEEMGMSAAAPRPFSRVAKPIVVSPDKTSLDVAKEVAQRAAAGGLGELETLVSDMKEARNANTNIFQDIFQPSVAQFRRFAKSPEGRNFAAEQERRIAIEKQQEEQSRLAQEIAIAQAQQLGGVLSATQPIGMSGEFPTADQETYRGGQGPRQPGMWDVFLGRDVNALDDVAAQKLLAMGATPEMVNTLVQVATRRGSEVREEAGEQRAIAKEDREAREWQQKYGWNEQRIAYERNVEARSQEAHAWAMRNNEDAYRRAALGDVRTIADLARKDTELGMPLDLAYSYHSALANAYMKGEPVDEDFGFAYGTLLNFNMTRETSLKGAERISKMLKSGKWSGDAKDQLKVLFDDYMNVAVRNANDAAEVREYLKAVDPSKKDAMLREWLEIKAQREREEKREPELGPFATWLKNFEFGPQYAADVAGTTPTPLDISPTQRFRR